MQHVTILYLALYVNIFLYLTQFTSNVSYCIFENKHYCNEKKKSGLSDMHSSALEHSVKSNTLKK
jgi:hypothetical protein